jgi:hypothetical protein
MLITAGSNRFELRNSRKSEVSYQMIVSYHSKSLTLGDKTNQYTYQFVKGEHFNTTKKIRSQINVPSQSRDESVG